MALGFYFDQTRCIGCKACQVACKDKNRLDVGANFREIKDFEVGEFPSVKTYSLTLSCQHCNNPACVEACPVGAMYKANDGTVLHDASLCVGCKACINACPYDRHGRQGSCTPFSPWKDCALSAAMSPASTA